MRRRGLAIACGAPRPSAAHCAAPGPVNPAGLSEQDRADRLGVADLAADDTAIARQDPADIAAALEAQDLAAGMKVTGDWPYDDEGNLAE